MRIYLDVCCLNRPFDDPSQERIRFESETVLAILDRCSSNKLILLSSEAVDLEISKIPDSDRKQKVMLLSSIPKVDIAIDEEIKSRAKELYKFGFNSFDAFHIACAEKGHADVLLTTDDHLLKKAVSHGKVIKIKIKNPLKYLMEDFIK